MLDEALTKAGVAHELYLLPANDHGFDMNWVGLRHSNRSHEDPGLSSKSLKLRPGKGQTKGCV
jgi:hypothetical protein